MADVLVVGSGAGGVHAAWALLDRGLSVALVDFGNVDREYAPLIPPRSWSDLRRGDEQQHRYFLGDRFEGIAFGSVRVGAQLTPPRRFIARDTERLLPVDSTTFSVTESLARGGLASGWGAGVFPFDDGDLAGTSLARADLDEHYETVAERIGVAGDRDDLLPVLGDCRAMLPPLRVDSAAERILARYRRRRDALTARGFALGTTRLAVCSQAHRGRGPHGYLDMDFWADTDRSVYRPRWTLEELQRRDGFELFDRRLVLSFAEDARGVRLETRHAESGEREEFRARALVLAAGALSTARIVLRSLGRYDVPVPVLCNPYTYVPVVNLGMAGVEPRDERHSLAQLTAVLRPEPDGERIVQAQYYSYRSLLTYKLMKESPLPFREALRVMRLLLPLLGILGIHHEDTSSPDKRCTLRRGGPDAPDRLEIDYRPDARTEHRQAEEERTLLRLFRRLGCLAIKRVRPGHGANIHYAGTLPMSRDDRELTCDADCRLRGARAVYLADGSVFPYLPAKGLTFTLMANANRVGDLLARRLQA